MESARPASLIDVVHECGRLTVAAFMDLALYDSRFGYYARAAQRTGRAGDFFTSVDVGPLFGELLETQVAEMANLMGSADGPFDLIEVGSGNGRLAADILRGAVRHHPDLAARMRLHLIEASPTARAAQAATLGDLASQLETSADTMPAGLRGVLIANELLDAMPVHQVVQRGNTLREVFVVRDGDRLTTVEGTLSTPAIAEYFDALGVTLEDGWRIEVNLRAPAWIADIGRRLDRGFAMVIDYGHPAQELYSASHAGGTLTTFSRHTMAGAESPGAPGWLARPGEQDITSHVDFTTVQSAARAAGFDVLGFLDQTYFLMGLLEDTDLTVGLPPAQQLKRRLALKTLLLPGGLGSTCKVLVLGKGMGVPELKGCSYRMRVT